MRLPQRLLAEIVQSLLHGDDLLRARIGTELERAHFLYAHTLISAERFVTRSDEKIRQRWRVLVHCNKRSNVAL